jgi:hypothetical protein
MEKINLLKLSGKLYSPSPNKVSVVDLPGINSISLDGEGDPNVSENFQNAVETLYSVSYTLKNMIKKSSLEIDYSVMPLEALWWTDTPGEFDIENKNLWKWTVMILQPDYINKSHFDESVIAVRRKKGIDTGNVIFRSFEEGLSAQIMHIGPFSEEGPTVKKVHDFMKENGYEFNGRHHEIYLNDYRRVAPENMKTIIRQPIKKL